MRKTITLSLLVLVLGLSLSGCITSAMSSSAYPPTGMVATEGVVIEGDFFELRSGEIFNTPYASITGHYMHTIDSRGRSVQDAGVDLLSMADFALSNLFGQRVRVTVPGQDEPLYGILVFSHLYPTGTGPATQSYRIVVPESYVQAALGGRRSVVYETYDVANQGSYTLEPKTWILWLSDMPL